MTNLIATDSLNLIVGGGVTGLSVARYFKDQSVAYRVYDTREELKVLDAFREIGADDGLYCGEFEPHVLNGVARVILSPGVKRSELVVQIATKRGIPVVSDITVFLEIVKKPVIGITGSNGKSTVTTMVGMAAEHAGVRVAVGGNIGTPALDLLAKKQNINPTDDVDLYVLELSSFQLESTDQANLAVAVHLNLSPDHLDRHGSMQAYFRAKQKIFFGAKSVVFNLSDPLTQPPVVDGIARFGFALDLPAEHSGICYWFDRYHEVLMKNSTELMGRTNIRQKGLHNLENVLALFAIADAAGLPQASVRRIAKTFIGLPHRCEFVREVNGVSYINDSKATNIGSTRAALKGFESEKGELLLIAGGVGKGADFKILADVIASSVSSLITIGEDGPVIASNVGKRVKSKHAQSLEQAIQFAKSVAQSGDIVLFSPACASFDMFENFEHRGERFKTCVGALVA